jgi:hypothetical protein
MPQSVKNLVRDAGLGVGVVRDGLIHVWPVVIAVLTLLALFVSSRRRRRARAPSQAAALGAYLDLTDVLAPRGHPLVEHATPREYLRGVSSDPAIERAVVDEAEVVVATLEQDRFSGRPAPDADLERARAAVATVRELVSRR